MLELAGASLGAGSDVSLTGRAHGYALWPPAAGSSTRTSKVVGSAPLVVVATGDVNVVETIHAEASYDQPGPGGAAPEMGSGAGGAASSSGADVASGTARAAAALRSATPWARR